MLFYIPNLVLANLTDLTVANPLFEHRFYVDNSVYAKRLGDSVTDPVLAVGGLGKGGKGYLRSQSVGGFRYRSGKQCRPDRQMGIPERQPDRAGQRCCRR